MTIIENKAIPTLPKPLVFNRSMTDSLSKMVLQLQRNHLVVLSGPSGSGKSTFATEILSRYLRNGETEGKNGKKWRTVVTAPFADPIGNLASALARRGALFAREAVIDRVKIEQTLRQDRNALTTLCAEAKKDAADQFNLLLVVDQKEELFRYRNILQELGRGGDDVLYVNLLLNAVQNTTADTAIYVVFVADTRNFNYFAHYRGLPEAMNNFRMELPDFSVGEIKAILDTYRNPKSLANYRDLISRLESPEEQESAGNNLAFFEWLAQQYTFVDRLLNDFDQLRGDPFATQKFNIFLCWVVQECTQRAAQGMESDPLIVYDQLGPMHNVVQHFLEKNVWNTLSPEQKIHTERLFKALTVPTSERRRPLRWENLQKLVGREKPFLVEQARELLSKFNTTSEIFFSPVDWEVWPDRVVDINADVLLDNWYMPQLWIDEEQKHADIYRDLVDAAIAFFSKKELKSSKETAHSSGTPQRESLWTVIREWWNNIYPTNAPKPKRDEPSESLYYEGATLANAQKWMKSQQPDAYWAARYDPPDTNTQHIQRRREILPAFRDASDWELAQRFLALSAEQEKLKRDQEEQSRQKLMRLQRYSGMAAGIASSAFIVAIGFWAWAERTNQKVKMMDFMELLEANGCLDISPAERFDKMYELTELLWDKNPTTEYDVMECLAQNGALSIDYTNETNKQIAFDALFNIGQLFDEQLNGDTASYGALKKLLAIYERTHHRPDRQFPMVYHAFLAHQNTYQYRLPKKMKVSVPEAAIENTALVSNPAKWHEYAYGDKNGRIFIRNERGMDTLPGIGQEIKSIGFSPDGKRLYAATKKGAIFKYEYGNYHSGIESKDLKTQIRKEDGTPIYFVREWDDQYLMICNTNEVRFLRKPTPPDTGYVEFHYATIPLSSIRRTDWSPNREWFLATGQDATIIYHLDPAVIYNFDKTHNGQGLMKETARITHFNITVASMAVKFDSLGRLWLALGGEEGKVWLAAAKDPSLLSKGCDISDNTWFDLYPNVHSSAISSIRFNLKYPQMASSDAYGFVYLWNLNNPGSAYDRIRVHRRGESITAIAYINPDELVAFESIHLWEFKTNIRALKEEVEKLMKSKLEK